MKDIKKQIEQVQSKTIGYNLQLRCETNKFGYDNLALYLNDSRLCCLQGLTNFEKNYILNRLNNVYIHKVNRVYKGQEYSVIAISEYDGFDNEYVILQFTYETKIMLMALLDADKVL